MAARLKVFVSSDGLTDYVVATTSRPKALAAWGVRQDLFKEGAARETDDDALKAEALAHPGEVLRRPAGTLAALAKLPARKLEPAKLRPAKLKPARPAKPKAPSKAVLKKVAALEARLAKLEGEAAVIEARRSEAIEAIETKARAERDALAARRRETKAALKEARRALGPGL